MLGVGLGVQQVLGEVEYRGERVTAFVRDAAHQIAERLGALRLHQACSQCGRLGLSAQPARDVGGDAGDARDHSLGVAHGGDVDPQPAGPPGRWYGIVPLVGDVLAVAGAGDRRGVRLALRLRIELGRRATEPSLRLESSGADPAADEAGHAAVEVDHEERTVERRDEAAEPLVALAQRPRADDLVGDIATPHEQGRRLASAYERRGPGGEPAHLAVLAAVADGEGDLLAQCRPFARRVEARRVGVGDEEGDGQLTEFLERIPEVPKRGGVRLQQLSGEVERGDHIRRVAHQSRRDARVLLLVPHPVESSIGPGIPGEPREAREGAQVAWADERRIARNAH